MPLHDGEKTPVESAYDSFSDILFRIAISYLKNTTDAEDAIQDVFYKYMTSAPKFSNSQQERAWLIRVTINRSLDIIRKNKHRHYRPLEEVYDIPSNNNEHQNNVLKAVYNLPPKYKSAIVLHYLEGFKVEEISKMIGATVSSVKMRLKRGRDMLKQILEEENYV